MRVVCLNDADQPEIIPDDKKLVKYEVYTVEKVVQLTKQNQVAFSLKELPLDPSTAPYEYWSAERFVPEDYYNEKLKFKDINFDMPLDIS
jgi:hypothetical protein